jgi:hypothetical protein
MLERFAAPVVSLTLFSVFAVSCRHSIPEDRAPEVFASDLCREKFNCDCDMYGYANEEQCNTAVQAEFLALQLQAEMMGLTYDGRCADRWLDFYVRNGCDTTLNDQAILGDFCDLLGCPMYHGTSSAGAPCGDVDFLTSDCDRGLQCDGGVCTELFCGLRSGDACADANGVFGICNAGLACDALQTMTCVSPPRVGDPCPGYICEDGATCDIDPMTGAAVCVALPGLGGDCTMTFLCAEGDCDAGVCVPSEPILCASI